MAKPTFEGAVQQSREFLDWSFGLTGKTWTDFELFRYGLHDDVRAVDDPGALTAIAIDHLRRGDEMPAELRDFVIDILEQKRPPRAPVDRLQPRNAAICQAVHRLVHEGFDATRNKAKGSEASAEGGSACDAVAVALHMSYSNVERIWNAMPPEHKRARKVVTKALK